MCYLAAHSPEVWAQPGFLLRVSLEKVQVSCQLGWTHIWGLWGSLPPSSSRLLAKLHSLRHQNVVSSVNWLLGLLWSRGSSGPSPQPLPSATECLPGVKPAHFKLPLAKQNNRIMGITSHPRFCPWAGDEIGEGSGSLAVMFEPCPPHFSLRAFLIPSN